MPYAASTLEDLVAMRTEVADKINRLQEELRHFDAVILRFRGNQANVSADDLEAPVAEPEQTLQELVEELVPVGTTTKARIVAEALEKQGLRKFKDERAAYNRVCAVLINSPLFERVGLGAYQRIEAPVSTSDSTHNDD